MIPITITPKSGRNPFGDIPMEITPGVEINEIEIKSLLECYESPIDLFSNNNLEEREFINEEEKNARELIDSISEHEKKFNQSLRETKNKKLTLPIFKLSGSYKRASEDLKKRLDV